MVNKMYVEKELNYYGLNLLFVRFALSNYGIGTVFIMIE